MKVIIYQKQYERQEPLDNFCHLYFSVQMKYLASDLLKQGFAPNDISEALQRAMAVGKASNMKLHRHFCPVITQVNGVSFNDCKLSQMGFALVLINANAKLPAVANWQLEVLEHYFEST